MSMSCTDVTYKQYNAIHMMIFWEFVTLAFGQIWFNFTSVVFKENELL